MTSYLCNELSEEKNPTFPHYIFGLDYVAIIRSKPSITIVERKNDFCSKKWPKIPFSAQEKLRKVVNKCKTDKTTIDELNKKVSDFEQKLEMANDKCNQTRDAQKLAEVKVMELEQRFATAQKELKEAQDDKCELKKLKKSILIIFEASYAAKN